MFQESPAIRVGPWRGFIGPTAQSGLPEFERRSAYPCMAGVDPGYLNAGLMKPRIGFTLAAGNENWGWARVFIHVPTRTPESSISQKGVQSP